MRSLETDRPLSASGGDYLKAIWELSGAGDVSTTDISRRLSVAPGSVTRALGRLREKGLIEHERYRGAYLTELGRIEALRLVRCHRLIETFLVEHLGYSWQEVHDEAERLEHAVSDSFTERLAEHLGHPERDPHGAPIPPADGPLPAADNAFPLSRVKVGRRVRVLRIGDESAPTLEHLAERGPLCLGCCSITQRDDASSEDPGARSAAAACKRADFPFFFGVFGCASVEQSRYDVPSPVSGSVTSLCVPPLRNEALQRFTV